jgi:hypothetical protein
MDLLVLTDTLVNLIERRSLIMTDEEIIMKVGDLFSRMEANERLQKLATDNGLDVKNSVSLTEEAKDNLAVTIVSLLLAKRDNDVRYTTLAKVGLQKRSIKTAIVNSYKDQAMALIERYKSA